MMRAALALVTILGFAMAGAQSASAADPSQPTVGGQLAAAGRTITVTSQGNVRARVTMAAESVTLSETAFTLDPGEAHSLTFTGRPVGYVSATMAVISSGAGDAGSATLQLSLEPARMAAPLPWLPIGLLIALIALLALLRALRPWEFRIARKDTP